MAEDTESLTELSRRFAERQARFREAMKTGDGSADLTLDQILAWADAHHAAHGVWPAVGPGTVSGVIAGAPGESWKAINHALALGLRGLPGDSSLAELLAEHRGAPLPDMGPKALAEKIWAWEQEQFPVRGPKRRARVRPSQRALTVDQILAWVDDFRARHGRWPNANSGAVAGAPGEHWSAINRALTTGSFGLPGGTTLRRLIEQRRDPHVRLQSAPLTIDQILEWMDMHRVLTGRWPTAQSGQVHHAVPALTWQAIQQALRVGRRGLPQGWSVAQLRREYREPRPELSVEGILAWADAHYAARGCWPTSSSGRIQETSRETWAIVNDRLMHGGRGLPGGQNLGQFLSEHRGLRRKNALPHLRVEQILAWADAHHAAHGDWPNWSSDQVEAAPGESWHAIDRALKEGFRGLPGGTKLSQLLAEHRGTPVRVPPPRLTVEQILAWADAHHAATGKWPTRGTGVVVGTEGDTWMSVCNALQDGNRGLPRSGALSELLATHRQARRRAALPRLTIEQILLWADAHHAAHGRWPTNTSGQVLGAPGESWGGIGVALAYGGRGLSGRISLAQLLAAHRPTRQPTLTLETVHTWALAHHTATGYWPTARSGPVLGAPGELWGSIARRLRLGGRGLPSGLSLATLPDATGSPVRRRPKTLLTVEQIQTWAKRHHAMTGRWPTRYSGPVEGAPGDEWSTIASALSNGTRGLEERCSLASFIHRYVEPSVAPETRKMTVEEILAWADEHHALTGRWPSLTSGAVSGVPGLTWSIIGDALRKGYRGVAGGSSLRRLLVEHRAAPDRRYPRAS